MSGRGRERELGEIVGVEHDLRNVPPRELLVRSNDWIEKAASASLAVVKLRPFDEMGAFEDETIDGRARGVPTVASSCRCVWVRSQDTVNVVIVIHVRDINTPNTGSRRLCGTRMRPRKARPKLEHAPGDGRRRGDAAREALLPDVVHGKEAAADTATPAEAKEGEPAETPAEEGATSETPVEATTTEKDPEVEV